VLSLKENFFFFFLFFHRKKENKNTMNSHEAERCVSITLDFKKKKKQLLSVLQICFETSIWL
jgi:hypothetical protein